jgi:hypothetical protein
MSNILKVVSDARKLTFKVHPVDVAPVFPSGANISSYGQNNVNPAIVVQNVSDGGTWQGADAIDGIVIINEVPEVHADLLLDAFNGHNLADVIKQANELGYGDIYTTSVGFFHSYFSPAGRMLDAYTGVVKRDARDICSVYQDSDGIYQIVVGANSPKRIEPDILLRTYRLPDGSPIDLKDIQ